MPWTFSSVVLMVNSSQVTRFSGLDAIVNLNLMSMSSVSFRTIWSLGAAVRIEADAELSPNQERFKASFDFGHQAIH